MEERLNNIRAKIDRANTHIRDLEAEVKAFLSGKPYIIGTKRDAETRRLVYYLTSVASTPICFSTIAGDAIQNLRSALDHLAYQLVIVGPGKTPSTHTSFPITDNVETYKRWRMRTKGMHADAIRRIDELEPYKGGNDTLWRIYKLDNIDKHRMLLTAGSAYRSVNIGHILERGMQELFSDVVDLNGGKSQRLNVFLRPSDRMFPLC
jgi:hypothetical protein